MQPILVTGGSGQLASALARSGRARLRVIGRPEIDFDRLDSIDRALSEAAPALVINAAAWTAVDDAEAAPDPVARANVQGPARLARLCHEAGRPFIHISTDYVFDGRKGAPYIERDATSPTGAYGRSKLAGEEAVLAAHPGAVILRTSWVYAETGRNFVRTMLAAARGRTLLRVVSDQIGCPTNADDLACGVLAVADALLDQPQPGQAGVTHMAGSGHTSWHGFTVAIFDEAGRHGWPVPEIQPIATADWPTPAARPADSRLDCTRLALVFGTTLPAWQPSLARTVATICRAG